MFWVLGQDYNKQVSFFGQNKYHGNNCTYWGEELRNRLGNLELYLEILIQNHLVWAAFSPPPDMPIPFPFHPSKGGLEPEVGGWARGCELRQWGRRQGRTPESRPQTAQVCSLFGSFWIWCPVSCLRRAGGAAARVKSNHGWYTLQTASS